jgi:hypothetical protein
MRAAGILVLTVLAVLCGTVNAQHEALRIGVVDFISDNVTDAQLRILSDRLRIELHNTGEFTVVEREQRAEVSVTLVPVAGLRITPNPTGERISSESPLIPGNTPYANTQLETERQARFSTMKRTTDLVSFACAAVAAGVAYKFNVDAQSAYDEGDAAYREYQQALTTEDAVIWREAFTKADARGDRTVDKRNLMLGIAGAVFCVGVAFTIW